MTELNENRVIQEFKGNMVYGRSVYKDYVDLVDKYTNAYTIQGHNIKKVKINGKVVISGLNSIYMSIFSLIKLEKSETDKINIIYSDELYCDTPKILKSFGCETSEINVCDPNGIQLHFQQLKNRNPNKTNILFVESSSNPNGNIFPFDLIPKLRTLSKKLYVVVDNTWLSHIIFNPFKYDVDIVVNSCSKYYSAGQCISGMILSKNSNFIATLETNSKLMGYHFSVDYCKLLLDSFETMNQRLIASHKNTVELTKVLKTYGLPMVRNSSDLNDPSHSLAIQYYNKFQDDDNGNQQTIHPSIININLNKPIELVKKLLKDNNIITQTSFGSSHTKVCNFIKSITPEITQIRISVGYDPIKNFEMFSFLKQN